ncbi:hypothetical protein [Bosea sp. (in: a-proteobacteria)]|uniref:hypothetical protein n=1 Tax=Bosea sp. (in: a-proteobacteria) TaxID=1871050 RepID=UPI00333F5C16
MFGGLGSFIASEVSGTVKRNATVIGLFAFAALLLLCAGGYALDAAHTLLTARYGAVAASLWVAGGLVLAALIAFCVGLFVRNRPRPPRPVAATAALAAAPLAARVLSSRTGWRVAALAGIGVLGTILGRQLFTGTDEDEA